MARSEFDGSQPSPLPGPPAAPGLAGVWTCSSRGMPGTPVLLQGAPTPQQGRPPPPAPRRLPRWGYHGKAAAAQGEHGLPGAPASSPRAARRDFSVVSSSAACPEGEVPVPHTGQQPPSRGPGCGGCAGPAPPATPTAHPSHARARRARATCAPRVRSTSWQSRAAMAAGSAPWCGQTACAWAGGLRGSPGPNTNVTPPHLTCPHAWGLHALSAPLRCPAPSPAHSFPFSTHTLQVPEPSHSLRTRHRHHRRGLASLAAAACRRRCRGTPACFSRACSRASQPGCGRGNRGTPRLTPRQTQHRVPWPSEGSLGSRAAAAQDGSSSALAQAAAGG